MFEISSRNLGTACKQAVVKERSEARRIRREKRNSMVEEKNNESGNPDEKEGSSNQDATTDFYDLPIFESTCSCKSGKETLNCTTERNNLNEKKKIAAEA